MLEDFNQKFIELPKGQVTKEMVEECLYYINEYFGLTLYYYLADRSQSDIEKEDWDSVYSELLSCVNLVVSHW